MSDPAEEIVPQDPELSATELDDAALGGSEEIQDEPERGDEPETAAAKISAPIDPEVQALQTKLSADPKLQATWDAALALEAANPEASAILMRQVQEAIGLEPEEQLAAAPALPETPLVKQADAHVEANEHIAWERIHSGIDNHENNAVVFKENLNEQRQQVLNQYSKTVNQIQAVLEENGIDPSAANKQAKLQADQIHYDAYSQIQNQIKMADQEIQRWTHQRSYMKKIDAIANASPELKKIKASYADAVWNGQVDAGAPIQEQLAAMQRLGKYRPPAAPVQTVSRTALDKLKALKQPKRPANRQSANGAGAGSGKEKTPPNADYYRSLGMRV